VLELSFATLLVVIAAQLIRRGLSAPHPPAHP
jgi:hypothetical protein